MIEWEHWFGELIAWEVASELDEYWDSISTESLAFDEVQQYPIHVAVEVVATRYGMPPRTVEDMAGEYWPRNYEETYEEQP